MAAHGTDVDVVIADFTQLDQVREAADQILERYPTIDVLTDEPDNLDAAIGKPGSAEDEDTPDAFAADEPLNEDTTVEEQMAEEPPQSLRS